MKGKGFKSKRRGRKFHRNNTLLAAQHILDMLSRYEELTFDDLRRGIFEVRRAAGLSMADALDASTARTRRGVRMLSRPIVECLGLRFPYVMATKNDEGITIYSRFDDWTEQDIWKHLDSVLEPNRKACNNAAMRARADMEKLVDAMHKNHANVAGDLEYQVDLTIFDEE